jgi:predicted secreted hydrolase
LRRALLWGAAILALSLLVYAGYSLWQRGMLPANEAADDWYEVKSDQQVLVQLPRDDAPHKDYMEWWYYNGHLQSDDGNRYSFHFAVFLINALATHTVAHVSFLDHQTGKHYTSQKRTPGNPSSSSKNGFVFDIGEWRMAGGGGEDRLRASTGDFGFNLDLQASAPPVMQGGTGLLDFELAGKSYYYSRPRMAISGAVKVGTEIHKATGTAWFDHQWGNFEVNQLGWDWFAIQLDDGTDIMIYQLFDKGGLPVLNAATTTRNGISKTLTEKDFTVRVTDRWTSERTGIQYPMGWQIDIPRESVNLRVTPVIRDSEFDGRETAYVVYWEGPVEIAGSHKGRGFAELSGYGKRLDANASGSE